jgi:hypothetical protein
MLRSLLSLVLSFTLVSSLCRPAHADDTNPMATVHVTSNRPVALERSSPSAPDEWVAVCKSPCDVALPLVAVYRIGGAGVRASEPFALRARDGERVVLTVDAGSSNAANVGTVAIVGGVVLLVAGLGYALVSAIAVNDDCNNASDKSACRSQQSHEQNVAATPGLVMAGVGLGLVIVAAVANTAASGATVQSGPVQTAWTRTSEFRGPGWSAPGTKLGAQLLTFHF